MFIIYVFVIVSEGLILLTTNMICYLWEVNHIVFFFDSYGFYIQSILYFIVNCIGLDTPNNCKDFSYM
jgi:hypothetical protein